jgi:hypothetical protein
MQKVFIGHNAIEANFVKDLLERAGITAQVRGEILSGLRPQIGIALDTLPSVWIADDSQLETARDLIDDYERQKTKR